MPTNQQELIDTVLHMHTNGSPIAAPLLSQTEEALVSRWAALEHAGLPVEAKSELLAHITQLGLDPATIEASAKELVQNNTVYQEMASPAIVKELTAHVEAAKPQWNVGKIFKTIPGERSWFQFLTHDGKGQLDSTRAIISTMIVATVGQLGFAALDQFRKREITRAAASSDQTPTIG